MLVQHNDSHFQYEVFGYLSDSDIFSTAAETYKKQRPRGIELARNRSNFNLKILNFNMGFTSYRTSLASLRKSVDNVLHLTHNQPLTYMNE